MVNCSYLPRRSAAADGTTLYESLVDHSRVSSRRQTAALILLIFTFKFILFIPQVYYYNAKSPEPFPWWLAIGKLAIGTYAWAALTPLILIASRRWQIERRGLLRNLSIHFCLGVVLAVAQTSIYHSALLLLIPGENSSHLKELPRLDGPWSFVFNGVLAYMTILAVHQAILLYGKLKERELNLLQAQLQLLQSELRPHFLFNTLNAVTSLIVRDQSKAERTLLNLSEMLRTSLDKMSEQESTLRDELKFVSAYLQIMQARFPGRFTMMMDISGEILEAHLPTMLLQPLIENSIRHGLLPSNESGLIEISAHRQAQRLQLVVKDDGRGIHSGSDAPTGGIGLKNIRARLKYLYGAEQHFEMFHQQGVGTTVRISLPFRIQL
jgi:two-component system, LytTR family, sensor kinase